MDAVNEHRLGGVLARSVPSWIPRAGARERALGIGTVAKNSATAAGQFRLVAAM